MSWICKPSPRRKQFVFFLVLETTASFQQLKFNKKLFNWLQDNNYWIYFHAMNTNFTVSLGWFMGMHPTLSSRDAFSELLNQYFEMEDIEFNLITTGQFYITKDKKKVNTKVVELHVDTNDAERTRELLSRLWFDQTFVEEIENRSVGLSIEFIPLIQRGVIDVPTFRECLRRHHEFATNTIGVSIVGIGGLDVSIQRMGTTVTLAKMIKQLQHDGKPLICGIEPTKFTNTEGRYLLLTQKALVDKAEEKFDKLIENLAKEGHLDKFQIDGKFLRHVNQVQSKAVATYAASLKARFKPPETVHVPPNPRPSLRLVTPGTVLHLLNSTKRISQTSREMSHPAAVMPTKSSARNWVANLSTRVPTMPPYLPHLQVQPKLNSPMSALNSKQQSRTCKHPLPRYSVRSNTTTI